MVEHAVGSDSPRPAAGVFNFGDGKGLDFGFVSDIIGKKARRLNDHRLIPNQIQSGESGPRLETDSGQKMKSLESTGSAKAGGLPCLTIDIRRFSSSSVFGIHGKNRFGRKFFFHG